MSSSPDPDRNFALESLRSATASPDEHARAWKQRTGSGVVGTFCSYVPEEVIIAAGALPFRILQVPGEFGRADASLQAYACCLARGALELGLADGLEFLDGVIFSNTCDTMQCLADIWSADLGGDGGGFVETFMMPVHVSHSAAREYVMGEIQRLIDALGGHLGVAIATEALSEAVNACRDARGAMAKLHEIQRGPSPVLTARQYYDATMARWVLTPTDYTPLIDAVVADSQTLERVGPRIVIAGGPMYAPALPELLDDLGACWVADDLCTACRPSSGKLEASQDPVAAIADRLLSRPPCPAKHLTDYDPGKAVVDVAREASADGVLVYRLKFCEPHSFDYPRVKEALDAAGLPSLLVEVETPSSSVGQLRTRLQAFLEMLADPAVSGARA